MIFGYCGVGFKKNPKNKNQTRVIFLNPVEKLVDAP